MSGQVLIEDHKGDCPNKEALELVPLQPSTAGMVVISSGDLTTPQTLPSPSTPQEQHVLFKVVEVAEKKHPTKHETEDEDGDMDEEINLAPDAMDSLTAANQFTVRKMAAQGLIDVALMMANISQLRTLVIAGSKVFQYYTLLTLVIFSLVAQISFATIIFVIYMREAEDTQRDKMMESSRQDSSRKVSRSESMKLRNTERRAWRAKRLRRHQITNRLNFMTVILVFVITVTNMFITGLGIKLPITDTTAMMPYPFCNDGKNVPSQQQSSIDQAISPISFIPAAAPVDEENTGGGYLNSSLSKSFDLEEFLNNTCSSLCRSVVMEYC